MDDSPSKPKPKTGAISDREGIWELSKEAAIERVVELETELIEFQESSKELEQALEDELHELELANEKLEFKYETVVSQLNVVNAKNVSLTQELTRVTEENRASMERYEDTVAGLRSQLVSVEIVNDNMENNDRLLESKLEIANQFNNELLEKIAILENDYYRERKDNIESKLHISNYENEIKQLRARLDGVKETSETEKYPDFHHEADRTTATFADESFLSMKDILNAGPPISKVSAIPKSNSLKKLHELTEKSEELSQKVHSFKTALVPGGLKSTSTTQLSTMSLSRRSSRESQRKEKEQKGQFRGISPSPSIMNLASIRGGSTQTASQSQVQVPILVGTQLQRIEGSPAKPFEGKAATTLIAPRRKKKGSIFNSLKSMGMS
ncbi:hypothetical protein CAAN1_26S00672 [[Candida] anglica]|uniref:NUDE domain-containing protein n=1 Tax=[Candida] anglica TaxID=148631 RepID=A0ABP0EHI3_9ASCO